jgi:pimeloyl-ACP methyl ester carboxylesterase
VITVPTITLDGSSNGIAPPTDGLAQAALFSGTRKHLVLDAGHNAPQEAPQAFRRPGLALASA